MVAIGSGGIFNGLTYFETDEKGNCQLRTGAHYILDRLPLAHVNQWIIEFHAMPKGMNSGVACRAPSGEGASQTVI